MSSPMAASFDWQAFLLTVQKVGQIGMDSGAQRMAVVDALYEALARLETPWETAFRIICTQPAQAASLKICHDVKLFHRWAKMYSGSSVKETEICALVEGDRELFARVLRHLSTTKIIRQSQPGHYALTDFSKALGSSEMADIVPYLYGTTLPGFTNLPKFLESTKYLNPDDGEHTNWHHMRGISRFDELKQNPADMNSFQAVMKSIAATKLSLADLIPVTSLISTRKTDDVLLVDVGGGLGHDILRFQSALLQRQVQLHPGSLVLQDIAPITRDDDAAACFGSTIVRMEHDFFDEQPVRGAFLYYLHTVLHDWTDDDAVRILSRLTAAAGPEYSRVLIHETILLTDKPSVSSTSQDMQMMMALSSRERTETEWSNIITRAGLVVQKIWSCPGQMESIIEAKKSRVQSD